MKQIVQQLASLLAYCNEVTGAKDTRLGDAIKRLAEGYKQNEISNNKKAQQ